MTKNKKKRWLFYFGLLILISWLILVIGTAFFGYEPSQKTIATQASLGMAAYGLILISEK